MRALPLLTMLVACDRAPEPPPLPTPPEPALAAPQWLVQSVTPDHVRFGQPVSAEDQLYSQDFRDPKGWELPTGAALDATEGRRAPGSLVLGLADEPTARGDVSHTIATPGGRPCTVTAWARTSGLTGAKLKGGASLEVEELGAAGKKTGKRDSLARHDHLPRLVGDTEWTELSMDLQTDRDTRALKVLLSGGRGRAQGQAWFDDVSVSCGSAGQSFLAAPAVYGGQPGAPVGRVRLDRIDRPAVLTPAPASWAVRVNRDQEQVLQTHVGIDPRSTPKVTGCFSITVDGDEAASACIDAGDGWERLRVPLPAQRGQTSVLGFRLEAEEDEPVYGAWGDPSLDPVAWPGDRPPDLVLVVFDTLRADDLGVGGNTARPVSPTLDALAASGTWYSQTRSPTSWTLPSMASLLTGVTPPVHGAGWRIRREVRHRGKSGDGRRRLDYSSIRPEAPRVAQRLRDRGYRTAFMASNHFLDRRFGFASGFSSYGDYAGSSLPGGKRALPHLRDALKNEEKPGSRPLFIVLHMLEPHLPYRARLPLPDGFELPDVFELEEQSYAGQTSRTLRKVGRKQEQHPDGLRVMHQLDTRYGDDVLGGFLKTLGDGPAVLFTSDHGEAFGEHDTFLHGHNFYDETVRVPLIVRWPDGAHAGTTVDAPAGLQDAAATLLDLAGADRSGVEGEPLVRPGAAADPDRVQFFEHIYKGYDRVGVLRGRHKMVRTLPNLDLDTRARVGTAGAVLYDVITDPNELLDLRAAQPALAEELDRLIEGRIDATLPGTHLACAAPHPVVTVRTDRTFVRGVPLGGPRPEVAPDRRVITLPASDGLDSRLVVEAAPEGAITVTPADACRRWDNAVPATYADLDDDQLDQLEAIGYVE